MTTKCLIYCRVSSQRQVDEGHGLDTQSKRCVDYARSKGYIVSNIFRDEGISGGLFERPQMHNLISYLDDHPSENYVIIFDDLSRFARDVTVHLKLKMELVQKRGAKLECLNFNFEASPVGELVEIILAGVSEFHRKDNRRQVIQKMKARMELGYWSLRSPPHGLRYFKDPIHGKILKPEQPYADIFKEAIIAYARGILNTLEETKEYIWTRYQKYGIAHPPSLSGVQSILSELLYTGYIEYKPWDIPRMKGKHEGFIDLETFETVQKKLLGKSKLSARKDYNLDFPLRGYVLCDHCGKQMTGAWCKGRKSKYPKYWCNNKSCSLKTSALPKSIVRDTLDQQFEAFLEKKTLDKATIDLAKDVILSAWEVRRHEVTTKQEQAQEDLIKLDRMISDYTDQIRTKRAENDLLLVKAYEDQLRQKISQKEQLQAYLAKKPYTSEEFRTANDVVMNILKEPVTMWKSDNYKDKGTIFFMYFDEKLRYSMKEGFRTATLALPVALMSDNGSSKIDLVEMPGIEPGSGKTL